MVSTPDGGTVFVLSTIALLVIAVSYAIISGFESIYGDASIEVKLAELVMVGNGQTSDTVHGNIIFTVDKTVNLLLAGDVREVELSWSGSAIDYIAVKDGAYIISYDGPLLLNEPVSVGDEIEIVIRSGGSETTVTATLGAAT